MLFKQLNAVLLVILACLLWGTIFIVPQFMKNFTPLEIALGRYFWFGAISLAIILYAKRSLLKKTNCKTYWTAFYYCLIMNFAYYCSLNTALRCCNPAVITLLIGISPITIALYGNWREGEGQGKRLIVPSILIFMGLILVNVEAIIEEFQVDSVHEYFVGLCCGVLSLSIWTWYAVANARFLRKNPDIDSGDWTIIIGLATFFCASVGIFLHLHYSEPVELEKFSLYNMDFWYFIAGCIMVALFCSWMAYSLWNYASRYVPISLMGQLAVFETIFGLCFVYLVDGGSPTTLEFWGMIIMLSGVILGITLLAVFVGHKPKAAE